METGIISETKFKRTRQIQLTSWVFATANSCNTIIEPLLSRFAVLEVQEYTFNEFNDIAISRLSEENIDQYVAKVIAEKVWYELGSRDIRDIIKVARLATSIEEIPFVLRMLNNQYRFGGTNKN
jgi:hypothetical protein